MSYTKTQWNPGEPPGISAENLNKIEDGIEAAHKLVETDVHTPDQSQTAQASGTLLQLQNFFANMFKRITGKTNWYDAPDTTLAAAKSHIDAAAPHSGHETPSGARAKVDAHAAGTSVHGATSAATASRIMMRDAAGRAKVAAPSANDDIARKDTVDAVQTSLDAKFDPSTGHKHTGVAGDGPLLGGTVGFVSSFDDTDPGTGVTRNGSSGDDDAWHSCGPTGSGCYLIWSELDQVPSNAKALILAATAYKDGSVSGGSTLLRFRKYGSSVTPERPVVSAYGTTAGLTSRFVPTVLVPVIDRKFEYYWTDSGVNDSQYVKWWLIGWIS